MFDALLVLSFGGPEGPDDVLPFLRNVTRGRNVPDERLVEVAAQYDRFGGVSPINDQNRALVAALRTEFDRHGLDLPVYWGNRNWDPYLADTVATMAADGIRHALVFVTSAFGSYSGCRQYREDLARAVDTVGPSAPTLDKLRLYHNHPGFLEPAAANVADALARFDRAPRLVFTAHSIPVSMAAVCDYESQLRGAAAIIAEMVGYEGEWDLVFQSRSGPPQVPWLEPDVGDHLRSLAAEGVTDVALCPLGFTSDHLEVLYDLDTLAAAVAAEVGIRRERATTVGTAPRFVSMVRELVEERRSDAPRLFVGGAGPWPDQCPEGHCLAPATAPRGRPSPTE